MADWSDTPILSSSFITHSGPNGNEIHFSTPDREKYLAVQETCRRQIDHAKPTNADRIRAMSDEELAEFIGGIYTLERDAWGEYDPCVVVEQSVKIRDKEDMLDWLRSPAGGEK